MNRLKKLAEDQFIANEVDFNQYLSSLQVLYQQIKFFHWITTGQNFRDVHLFFDETADKLLEIIDETAERMTFLQITPIFSPAGVESKSYIKFDNMENFNFNEAMKFALNKTIAITNQLTNDIKNLEQNDDYGSVQILSEHVYKLEDNIQRYRHFMGQ